MPCFEMLLEFKKAKVRGEEYYELPSDNQFVRALDSEFTRQNIRRTSSVRIYSKEKLTCQVDMLVNDGFNTTRKREVISVRIDELHDMAVQFLPPHDPNKPMTASEMFAHFHPGVPPESGPMAPTKREFVRIETIDGYQFEETWK